MLWLMSGNTILVHLVRHGETALNQENRFQGWTDVGLSLQGIKQAATVAAYLASRPIQAVYSSSLIRAVQTADAIALPHGLSPILSGQLRELHHGELENLPFQELGLRYPEILQEWIMDCSSVKLPAGESMQELQTRAWQAFQEAVRTSAQEICVVSHKLALATIIAQAIGLPLKQAMRLELELASISTMEYGQRRGWRLLSLNAAHPLYAKNHA